MQLTNHILMIRPARFEVNRETAETNHFQTFPDMTTEEMREQAQREFDTLAARIEAAGVKVTVIEDTDDPPKPDAVFPNNWISFHPGGRIFTFPMQPVSRRAERRAELVQSLAEQLEAKEVTDLGNYEGQGKFLEGTGSMVMDHENKVIYACLSQRTHPEVLADFASRVGYEVHPIHAVDEQGKEIYHTNVFMCIGDGFATLCTKAIPRMLERVDTLARLEESKHEIIDLSFDQMGEFAGNMLHLRCADNKRIIVMSDRARNCLTLDQAKALEQYGEIISAPLGMIECSGGSARCMIAEVFE